MMSDTVRVNINVSPELYEFYKEQAKRAGVSMSAMMSVALLHFKDAQQPRRSGSAEHSVE